MVITIFNGSPHAEKGNTHRIARELAAGAQEAGATVENVFLAEHDIRPCNGCFACWVKTPGKCVIPDDMAALLPKIPASDVVVLATPLHIDNVSGIMKTFMDRFVPLITPLFEKDANGESIHAARYPQHPKLVVISNCGFPEQSHFQVLRLLFQRIARNMQTEVVGEIYRGEGELLRARNSLVQPFLQRYRELLRQAGKELVETGRISQATMVALEKPLVPPERYLEGANSYWKHQLNKLETG